jgi:lipopolysaccharide export system protein LptA
MTCTGAAQLDDRRLGNTARGEGAVYDLTSRTVTMWGEPVVLRKSDGAVVEGHRVVYSVDSGKARVVGEEKPAVVPAPAPPLPAAEPPSTAAGDDGR